MVDWGNGRDFQASWDFHAARPHIPYAVYETGIRVEFARDLNAKTIIYLDMNFWIKFRQARLGQGGAEYAPLLDALTAKVGAGLIVCPAGEVVFNELMKQSDDITRQATAQLIQDLSGGACLINSHDRSALEFSYAIDPSAHSSDLLLQDVVWTKLSYVVGQSVPEPAAGLMNADQTLIMQKMVFDRLWDMPFTEMVKEVGQAPIRQEFYVDLSSRMNIENQRWDHEITTFADAFKYEALGAPWVIPEDAILDTMLDIAEDGPDPVPPMTQALKDQMVLTARQFTGSALFRKTPVAVKFLPTLLTYAMLHASVRWDRGMKMTQNHLFDFDHAAAAMGYCDYFFTDGPLHARLVRKEFGLDKVYPCKVASTVDTAMAIVEAV